MQSFQHARLTRERQLIRIPYYDILNLLLIEARSV
jgi:hypothetical protein